MKYDRVRLVEMVEFEQRWKESGLFTRTIKPV